MTNARLFAAALVFVLAACGTSAGTPSGTPTPAATATASSTASASVAASASATASVEASTAPSVPDSWEQVATFGDGAVRLTAGPIVRGSAGFLALGNRWEGGHGGPRVTQYAMWHSPTGLAWSELPYPTGFGDVFPMALAGAADGSYILHGTRETATPGTYEPVALRSTDATAWQEISSGLPPELWVQAVALGPSGYLLVGGQGAETDPTLWLSADGLSWEQIHTFDQTTRWVQIHDADGGAEGYVVLGRRIGPDGGEYERFAFASADGREWFERAAPFGPDDQDWVFEATITSRGPDWVATLGQPNGTTDTWFSANGLDWTALGGLDADANTIAGVFDEIGDELIFSPGSGMSFDGPVGVWSSTDGAAWSPLDLQPGADAWLGGVAQSDSVVAITATLPGADFTSTVGIWVRSAD